MKLYKFNPKKFVKKGIHSWWVDYKNWLELDPFRPNKSPDLFVPEVKYFWDSIIELHKIRSQYFGVSLTKERVFSLLYSQTFYNYVKSLRNPFDFLYVSTYKKFVGFYNDEYIKNILDYVFIVEEFEDVSIDFLYWGPLEVVYNTLYGVRLSNFSFIVDYFLLRVSTVLRIYFELVYSLGFLSFFKKLSRFRTRTLSFSARVSTLDFFVVKLAFFRDFSRFRVFLNSYKYFVKIFTFRSVMYMYVRVIRILRRILYLLLCYLEQAWK